MAVTVRHSDARWLERTRRRVSALRGRVAIGYPSKAGADNVAKAYVNEFGTAGTGVESSDLKHDIPARPFLSHAVPRISEEARGIAAASLVRDGADVCLERIGAAGAEAVRDQIVMGDHLGNADYTLAHKTGDAPLIDSGRMRDAATFEVLRGGAD